MGVHVTVAEVSDLRFVCLVLFVLTRSFAVAAEYGPSAVWKPSDDFRQEVIASCGGAGARFSECFVTRMKDANASPEALAFTTALQKEGYMRAFRAAGRVSIAAVTYPFRANENEGLLLVNGEPAIVDVDKVDQLPVEGLKQLAAKNPKANLWPGDRTQADKITVEKTPEGGQRFLVDYRVQNGCHACAVLGKATYAFEFDKDGKFVGVKFIRVQK